MFLRNDGLARLQERGEDISAAIPRNFPARRKRRTGTTATRRMCKCPAKLTHSPVAVTGQLQGCLFTLRYMRQRGGVVINIRSSLASTNAELLEIRYQVKPVLTTLCGSRRVVQNLSGVGIYIVLGICCLSAGKPQISYESVPSSMTCISTTRIINY